MKISTNQIEYLFTGNDWGGLADNVADDPDAIRAVWEANRAALLEQWIANRPGSRPFAWWTYDAPEPRRRIDGPPHPFKNRQRDAHAAEFGTVAVSRMLYYGKPQNLMVLDDHIATYESEAAYLDRLKLLTPAERAAIAANQPSQ